MFQTLDDLSFDYNNFSDYPAYERAQLKIFYRQTRDSCRLQWDLLRATMRDASPDQILARFRRWWERKLNVFKTSLLREYRDDELHWLYMRLHRETFRLRQAEQKLAAVQENLTQTRAALEQECALTRILQETTLCRTCEERVSPHAPHEGL
jgi:hypothetical protein